MCRLQGDDFQVVILSPGSFESVVVRTALRSVKERIHCVAMDEAHCIEQYCIQQHSYSFGGGGWG